MNTPGYEYKFERILTSFGFVTRTLDVDYRQVIVEYCDQGWEFVQIFAPAIFGNGLAPWFDLIFRRPKR